MGTTRLRRDLGLMLALAAIYLGAARLGLGMAFAAEQVSAVWPPTGIALAALLLGGTRLWPGVALGAFLANITTHEPFGTACGIAAGNTLEALAGTWLLRRWAGFDPSLERLRDVFSLIVLAAAASTTVSATVGVASLCLGGIQSWEAYGKLWQAWWLGNATGTLVVAPALLAWATKPRERGRPRRPAEAVTLAVALSAVSLAAFAGHLTWLTADHPLEYVIFPFVIWAALRFGPSGTAVVTLVASVIAIWGTARGFGPFNRGTVHESLLLLQIFLAAVAVTGLVLSAAMAQRDHAEAALRASEARYRDLFENAHDIFYTHDLEGRFTSVNKRAEQTFGYDRAEILGRSAFAFIPPEYHARVRDSIQRKLAGATGPIVYELEVVGKDGQRVPLEVSSRLIVYDGRPVGVQGCARDITERKRAEKVLQEADQRKDEFLAMLAHELRNPLAPIRNALHVLKLPDTGAARTAQMQDMMERQVQHLTRLVDDLLDVSRIMRGKIELRLEPVDLATVVARAVETVQPVIEAEGHQLTVTLPPEPVYLQGDLVRLAQVFANLLNNAAKYTERAGHIWLTAQRDDGGVVVRVRDSGVGMAPEMLPYVFDLFVQADRSAARSQGGLGIGLTLVRRLVELHGGSIRAASAGPGQGSEFTLRFPALPPRCDAPPTPRAGVRNGAEAAPSARRILVVDDNTDVAESLALVLRLGGHDVQVAHDGPGALEAAHRYCPDVVLLDIGLPGMTGYEVARLLRQQPPAGLALLVALSGYGQAEDRRRAREAGFDHHLTKPVDPPELLKVLAGPPVGRQPGLS